MRLLTYNLWHGLSPSTPVAFEALEPTARRELRYQKQLELFETVRPDVAFLQEVNPLAQRAPGIDRALESRSVMQPDLVGLKLFGVGLPLNLASGLMTAVSRPWPLRPLEAISLSRPGVNLVKPWGSWQLREERFALFSETLWPKWGKVLLVNTHFHHGLDATTAFSEELDRVAEELELPASLVSELRDRARRGDVRRRREMDVLMKTIENHSRRYAAVVLGGDLNSVPESETATRLREAGFRDVWAEAHPDLPGLTFDSQVDRANHLLQDKFPLTLVVEDLSFSAKVKETLLLMARRHFMRPRRIDYIWIRGENLQIRGAKLVGQPDADGLAPSDHQGVLAEIEAE